MKKILLLYIFSTLIFSDIKSQNFCNVNERCPDFLANASQSVLYAPGPFTVRIFVYIIRNSSCEQATGMTDLEFNNAMNYLTSDFASHNICFSLSGRQDICDDFLYYNDIPGVFSYINNNQASYLHSNAIDIFFCPNTSGAPGGVAHGVPILNAPPGDYFVVGGTFPANTWSGVNYPIVVNNSHVVSHEMGHCLGLFHTFHGQPGCEPQGCEEHDISPFNINCGDLVPDTHADPCLQNGNANFMSCTYTGFPIDPITGIAYTPDMYNFMSYMSPNCYQHFTQGQGQRMRSFIASNYLLTPRVVPQDVYVQNKVFTQGTTLYAGTTSVTAGSNVTIPPYGNVVIKSTSETEFKSNNYITLEKGFLVEPGVGGDFYAHIDPAFCSTTNQINSGKLASIPYYPLLNRPKWYSVIPTVIEGTAVRKIEDIGDTLFNGTAYTIINIAPVNLPNLPNTYFFFTDTGNIYLREDVLDKKVYQKSSTSGFPDSLIYDFSLNVGDAFPGIPAITLTTIDSVLIASGYHKRFIFTYANDSIVWIEGVGNITNPLGTNAWFYYPGFHIICSYQNDTLVYDEGGLYALNCGNLTSSVSQPTTIQNQYCNLYPNPANDKLILDYFIPENVVGSFSLMDISGKQVFTSELKKQNNQLIIPCKKISSGIYFFNFVVNDAVSKTGKVSIIH